MVRPKRLYLSGKMWKKPVLKLLNSRNGTIFAGRTNNKRLTSYDYEKDNNSNDNDGSDAGDVSAITC